MTIENYESSRKIAGAKDWRPLGPKTKCSKCGNSLFNDEIIKRRGIGVICMDCRNRKAKRNIKMHERMDKEWKEKLGIKEITYGEFLGHVYQLQEYLTKRKNWDGLSVLNQLIPRNMLEDMVVQFVAAESFKDNLVNTPSGLAIRDIDVEEDKKK